ncbi:LodA/GoxA family CTQ-dependent oxidase [Bradyrhizobium sp. 33ap4]|uniref:LodA/GoxA family CTQ-dependent oxidase n=1 Tax=Bradyrhizobium sp. 33ap4 TaxID=3061630 RepID=UPI0029310012|nr:LodA/GoxA family CTQ-dependent oxidase [Bradyrhizobium sp. 33ap4]
MIDPKAISELKVYPPIGVARVGNADGPHEYVIGPEVIGGSPTLPGGGEQPARYVGDFRNAKGQIKRQAARFRVYAHMRDGSVQEVTAAAATIEWHVSVANLKAGWYEFNQAMDLGQISQNALLRNRDIVGPEDRWRLDIIPTARSISGQNAASLPFGDGRFFGKQVYLGELRTDAEGRLLFLGGRGNADAFRGNMQPVTFANNSGWHDDLCDGPVRARVTFEGHDPIDAEPGYVTVTPPNYAPGLFGLVTMDDVVREVFYDQKWLQPPSSTSFGDDVLPLFQRLTGMQWVNHGLFIVHGFGSSLDANDPRVAAKLNDNTAPNAAWRKRVLELFRDPGAGGTVIKDQVPQTYGDGVDVLFDDTQPQVPSALLAVTRTQYAHLTRWASGNFTPGASVSAPVVLFSKLTAVEQVEHLERAPLHDCLGGPFHPAMEMTWVMRIPLLWKSKYRLKVLPGDDPAKQDFGDTLTPSVCTGAKGPYDGAAAGCLTRFLGVPWQTDHTSCNSAADYFPSTFLSMPTFWGPRAPDQVLADGNFLRAAALAEKVESQAQQQILKHLMNRVDWLRDIRGNDSYDRLSLMIKEWSELGMVLPVEGAPASLPVQELRVEQGRHHKGVPIDDTGDPKYHLTAKVEDLFDGKPASAALTSPAVNRSRPATTIQPPPKRRYRQGEI